MEFRPTTLSRGLSLSNRPVDDLKVCGQDDALGPTNGSGAQAVARQAS